MAGDQPPPDRAGVQRALSGLLRTTADQRAGTSAVIEGPPGIGKTFLVRQAIDSLGPGAVEVLRAAGAAGRAVGR
jgi:MoxR-like ATPase